MKAPHLRQNMIRAASALGASWRARPGLRRLIIGLLGLNVALILLPVLLEMAERAALLTPMSRPFLHPTTDGSLQELFNYAQTGICAAMLGLVALRRHSVMALAWACVFGFVLIDDALMYHETFGAWLAQVLGLPALGGLRPVDLGELLAWALAGAVVAPIWITAFLRTSGTEQGLGLILLALFGGLVFFAVGVDLLHAAVPSQMLMVAEDGGEMIAIALACAVSLLWAEAVALSQPPLRPVSG